MYRRQSSLASSGDDLRPLEPHAEEASRGLSSHSTRRCGRPAMRHNVNGLNYLSSGFTPKKR